MLFSIGIHIYFCYLTLEQVQCQYGQGRERLYHTKYQIVISLILLFDRPWLGGRSSAFALLCQYLVHCTGPGTFHFLSTEEGRSKLWLE